MASCRLAGLAPLVAALLLGGCEARPGPAPAPRSAGVTRTTTVSPPPVEAAALAPADAAAPGQARAGVSPQFARNVDEAMATLHREHEGD